MNIWYLKYGIWSQIQYPKDNRSSTKFILKAKIFAIPKELFKYYPIIKIKDSFDQYYWYGCSKLTSKEFYEVHMVVDDLAVKPPIKTRRDMRQV